LVSSWRFISVSWGTALVGAVLATGGCGSSDGKVDDPGLPYSYSYPEEFKEGGQAKVSAREQGFENQTIVAKQSGQDYVAVQTQPLRRTVAPKLIPRIKRELEQSSHRTGRIKGRRNVRIADLDGVAFEMNLRGTGVPVGARWIYLPKGRTLYWINCQWQKDRARIVGACDKVAQTFMTR
jgi:hypothetical protein